MIWHLITAFTPEYRNEVRSPVRWTDDEKAFAARALKVYGETIDDAQLLFRRTLRRELGGKFQELYAEDDKTCFLESGDHWFDNVKIQRLLDEAVEHHEEEPPVSTSDYDQWEAPQQGHVYAAGADTAEGVPGGDYSVLAIFCVTCDRQAFRYRARVGSDEFAEACNDWGRKYNRALLAVEINNTSGGWVNACLKNAPHRYPNLYTEEVRRLVKIGHESKPEKKQQERKYGWKTDNSSRDLVLSLSENILF